MSGQRLEAEQHLGQLLHRTIAFGTWLRVVALSVYSGCIARILAIPVLGQCTIGRLFVSLPVPAGRRMASRSRVQSACGAVSRAGLVWPLSASERLRTAQSIGQAA